MIFELKENNRMKVRATDPDSHAGLQGPQATPNDGQSYDEFSADCAISRQLKAVIAAAALVLFESSQICAQSVPDSLSHYLDIAALNNPGVLQKYDEYRASLEKAPQAASLPDPRLDIAYFVNPMQLPGGDQVADLKLMQMFPWFGTLSAAKDEASKMARAKYEGYRDAQLRLHREVKSSWYQVYRVKKEINITVQNLEYLKALERLALAKMKTGQSAPAAMGGGKTPAMPQGSGAISGGKMRDGTLTAESSGMSSSRSGMPQSRTPAMGGNDQPELANVLRIRIDMLALQNRLTLLQDQFQTEQARFNRHLGRPPETAIVPPDTLEEAELPASPGSLKDSLSRNPMVRMNLAEQEAYAAKIKMASRMGRPMLGIGAGYTVMRKRDGNPSMMNGDDMIMPMVSLTLPIYRKKYRALRREAACLRDASARSAEDALLSLQVRYREALQTYKDAGRRMVMYAEQAALARQSVEVLTAAFASGGDNFDALLQLQQDLLEYEFKEVEALVDRNTAVADLEALAGPDADEWKGTPDEH
ncbi:TolC family protein [Fibrobacterota bacterium]